MTIGQQVQAVAKHLAKRLMQGTKPQPGATIEVTVSILIRNEDGDVTLSSTEPLQKEWGTADGRSLNVLVSE